MEIITGVERRRRWPLRDKLRIVAEVEEPGASFGEVARRNDVSRGLLWNWQRQVRQGLLRPEQPTVFIPVQIAADPQPTMTGGTEAVASSAARGSRRGGRMEIDLGSGRCIRVDRDVDTDALRRVLRIHPAKAKARNQLPYTCSPQTAYSDDCSHRFRLKPAT